MLPGGYKDLASAMIRKNYDEVPAEVLKEQHTETE